MIELDYTLSPSWKRSWEALNLAEASETDLLYRALLGDIIFRVDSNDFSAKWGWIPVVGFAASLSHIIGELVERDGVETTFDFTESDAVLRFKRAGEGILISASYAPGEAYVPLTEFTTAVNSFSRRVANELSQQFPSLCENKSLQQLFSIPD
jgi:hypothetical protein